MLYSDRCTEYIVAEMAGNGTSRNAFSSPNHGINITPVLVGVITVIAIAIAILFTLILLVWCLKCRQTRVTCSKSTADHSKPDPSMCLSTPAALTLPHTRQRARSSPQEDISLLSELVNARAKHASMPTKLDHQPRYLQPNPMYSSTDDIEFISSWDPETCKYEMASPSSYEYSNDLLHSYASICYDQSYECVPGMTDIEPQSPLQVTPENVLELHSLGEGQFGQVVLAETVGLSRKDLGLSNDDDDKTVSLLVAIKKLKPDAGRGVRKAFEREVKLMSHFSHENIVSLLGVGSSGNSFIMMEHMENGDLNQYLKKHCAILSSPLTDQACLETPSQITISTLVYMAVQIANGMEYLVSLRCIHRDLATRNCLVGQNHVVKIADFGLSRTLYSSHYYKLTGCALVPIRWMATECFYGKFSEKTDVWSFGITLWEIFMLARQQPFSQLSNQQVICDAVRGPDRQLLPKPEHCPPGVYEVMLRCWVYEPNERASFEDVCRYLAKVHTNQH